MPIATEFVFGPSPACVWVFGGIGDALQGATTPH